MYVNKANSESEWKLFADLVLQDVIETFIVYLNKVPISTIKLFSNLDIQLTLKSWGEESGYQSSSV